LLFADTSLASRIAIQVDQNDPTIMSMALNYAKM